ncbi:8558_t:CDS:1 [Paraglomus brasilianum]|uniref:8558_t:CDS:1 n=1 Tax=Paraglomus brasilianum TaxID=144538 RepID=A0A9N9GHB1_9GLOM|nr:8558_t:CDS:1 [Paraglomus brasilianum]
MSTDTPTTSIFDYTHSLTPSEIDLLYHPPYNLFLSLDVLLDPTYKSRVKQCPLLPRAQNSWIIFRRDFESRLRDQHPTKSYTVHDVSKIAGDLWKVQSDVVKEYFCVLSKLAQKRHQLAFPDYVYKPKRTRQRKRNGKFLFKNMDKATFTSQQNNRTHAQGNIEDTSIKPYQANESDGSTVVIDTDEHLIYENTYNDIWLEGSFQEDDNYATPSVSHDLVSVQLTSPDNLYDNNICDADSASIYPIDEIIYLPTQYFVYNPTAFSIFNFPRNGAILETVACASSDNTYQMDTFNIDVQPVENNGQTWPAEFYYINEHGQDVFSYSIMYENNENIPTILKE